MLDQRRAAPMRGYRVNRRGLLGGAAAAGAGALLAACGGGKSSDSGKSNVSSAPKAGETAAGAAQTFPAGWQIPVNSKAPKPGGTFRWWTGGTTHAPNDPETNIGISIWNWIGERALEVDPITKEIQPSLVEKWETPDPTTILFRLRPNVFTHDKPPSNGRVFTTEDLAWSISRKAARIEPQNRGKYPRANQFDAIDRIEAVDGTTVRLTLKQPDSTVLAAFTDIRAQMTPRDYSEQIGFDDAAKAVGTGPWVITEYALNDRETFKKHPKYWQQGLPMFDVGELRAIADRASALSAFINGDIHVFTSYLAHEQTAIKGVRGDTLFYSYPGPTWDHFRFNVERKPFTDVRVRKAFQLAIDYKALGDAGDPGWTFTGSLHSSFPEAWKPEKIGQQPGFNPATKKQDIEEAQKLLEAAGFPKGAGISFKSWMFLSTGRNYENNVRIKDQFAKVFPQMNMELASQPDYGAFTKLQVDRNFDMTCYNHTTVPDATLELRTYYHSSGGRNYSGFKEPLADELLDKALNEFDNAARVKILDDFQGRYLKDWMPLIDLYVPAARDAYAAKVGGYDKVAGTWSYAVYGSYIYRLYFTE